MFDSREFERVKGTSAGAISVTIGRNCIDRRRHRRKVKRGILLGDAGGRKGEGEMIRISSRNCQCKSGNRGTDLPEYLDLTARTVRDL